MSPTKYYICCDSNCNEIFTRFAELKSHEAKHAPKAHRCTFPGCDFATLSKTSFTIHFNRHTGEKRCVCPDCTFRTHDPSALTRHRQKRHEYIPDPRGRFAVAPSASSSSQPPAPSSSYQFQANPNIQYKHYPNAQYQSHPNIQYQSQADPNIQYQHYPNAQYQSHSNTKNSPFNVFYGPGDTSEDYSMYREPARTADGWTEGCMCPEWMERRPSSELLGYAYRAY